MSTSHGVSHDDAASHRCAACGKGGEGLKKCTACLEVRYCGVECQARHRRQHQRQCRVRAAELFDEKLFAPPPPPEECPICFLPLPANDLTLYEECCGKLLCNACAFPDGDVKRGDGPELEVPNKPPCPFCRSPPSYTDEVMIERYTKRAAQNNPVALQQLGMFYVTGMLGLQVDEARGMELIHRAAALGRPDAHATLGEFYLHGEHGLEEDPYKAIGHFQKAAMGGHAVARHILGLNDQEMGKVDQAMKHFMIAAASGFDQSLKQIRQGYISGKVSKADYATALRSHKNYTDELKSERRVKVSKALS